MTFWAHAISASVVSLMINKVDPSRHDLTVVALISAGVLDLDHAFYLIRDWRFYKENGFRGTLHKARSVMHELMGVAIMGFIAILGRQINAQLFGVVYFSYLIHMIEDIIMGRSFPFNPVKMTEMRLFKFNLKHKAVAEVVVISISLFLWWMYLKG